MHIKHQKDFLSGLLFLGVGLAFAWGATHHSIGSAASMGPGYLPLVLGVLLCLLGAVITFKALVVESEDGGKVGRWAWKPLLCVLGANLAFGALLVGLPSRGVPAMGLVVAIYALTFIASFAVQKLRWLETFVVATVLAFGSYFAFVVVLKLPLPAWPAFFGG